MHHAGHRIARIVLWLLTCSAVSQIPNYVAENSGNLWHYDDVPVTWNMAGKRYQEAHALLESNLLSASMQPPDLYSGFLTALGITCFKQNDLERAEKFFTLAVKQFHNARAYRERGLIYLAQQKVWQAKNDFKKAADLADAEAVKLLARLKKNK